MAARVVVEKVSRRRSLEATGVPKVPEAPNRDATGVDGGWE